MRPVHEIIKKPRITEKATRAAEKLKASLIVFEVSKDSNKLEIRRAVESAFNVEVESVRTMIVRGKVKRKGRSIGKRSNWKKAVITLKPGNEIDLFGTSTAKQG